MSMSRPSRFTRIGSFPDAPCDLSHLQRVGRAVCRTARVWAVTWGAAAALLLGIWMAALLVTEPRAWHTFADAVGITIVGAVLAGLLGGVAGSCFGVLIALCERGLTVNELSLARVCVWGIDAGAIVGIALGPRGQCCFGCGPDEGIRFAVLGVLGAACSTGTLLLARLARD